MKRRIAMAGAAFVTLLTMTGCGTNGNNTVNPAADVMNATQRATQGAANATQRAAQGAANGVNATHRAAQDAANGATNATQRAAQGPVVDQKSVQLANKIANGLVKQGYAHQAFAFVVGDNAYVAIHQKGRAKTNMGLADKDKISNAVKRMDHRIHNVYVSANPDAYQRFQSFANDMQAGKPVSAIWNNFRTTISRVFPTAH